MTHLQFFPGFRWAVPLAFADPVAGCRFEQGDVLYEKQEAYLQSWSEARQTGMQAIQVLSPSRGVAGPALAVSWDQEVVFEWHDWSSGRSQTISTSQGRLYHLLWKGEDTFSEPGSEPVPLPRDVSDLKKNLEQVTGFFQTTLLPDPEVVRFLMPTDTAASHQREKLLRVKTGLERDFPASDLVLEPANKLGLGLEFLPTVMVACFEMKKTTREKVEQALHAILYKPSAGGSAETGRFRLKAHGLIL